MVITKQDPDEWFVRILGGACLWFLAFIVFLAIFPVTYLLWGWFNPNTTFRAWQGVGILIWMIALVVSIVFTILHFYKNRRDNRRHKQSEWIWDENGDHVLNPDYVPYDERSNIFIEFIKAKYNKYCPKIDWNK